MSKMEVRFFNQAIADVTRVWNNKPVIDNQKPVTLHTVVSERNYNPK